MDHEAMLRVHNNRLPDMGDGDRNGEEVEVMPAMPTDYEQFCFAIAILLGFSAVYWLMMALILVSQKLFKMLN